MAFLLHSPDYAQQQAVKSSLCYEETFLTPNGTELTQIHNKVRVDGTTVPYTVTAKDPSQLEGAAAALLIGGFFSCEEGYLSLAEENAERDIPTITYNDPRLHGLKSFTPGNLLHPENIPLMVAHAVAKSTQAEYGVKEFDLTGHSMGGEAAFRLARFAIRQSSGPKYRSLHLLASAGATGHHMTELALHIPGLRREAAEAIRHDPRRRSSIARRSILYAVENPVRAAGEALRTSESSIPPEGIAELQENEITTIGTFYLRDKLFPGVLAEKRLGHVLDYFQYGQPASAGHLAPHTEPAAVSQDYQRALQQTGLMPVGPQPVSLVTA